MQSVCLINVVGLSESLLHHAPRISALGPVTRLEPVLPAVTCSVQASMLTSRQVGKGPRQNGLRSTPSGGGGHGVVGNGWFNHEQQTIDFWKQSNKLVEGDKVWDVARRRAEARGERFTCANLFWWFNMYSSVDWSVTPRPIYKADGRKLPDVHTAPASLRDDLQRPVSEGGLGQFPLFNFWGPMSDIKSSRWIAEASKRVVEQHDPTLTLVYLPHLDYGLQKLGPEHPEIPNHVAEIDEVTGDLIDAMQAQGRRVLVVSEYGIEPVHTAIPINRILREAGLLAIREEDGLELMDAGASRAFAVADHQVAHVYHPPETELPPVPNTAIAEIDHPRAGQAVLVADEGCWFTYDYWFDDTKAPDFARTVDIHRKPGYDPRELFTDKSKAQIAWRLLKKKLGFRQLMDVIPLDPSLVKGSHGRTDVPDALMPVLLGAGQETVRPCMDVFDVLLETMGLGTNEHG